MIRPFGEGALLVELGPEPDRETTRRVHGLAAAIEAFSVDGIRAVTPGFASLLVEFDPLGATRKAVEAGVRAALAAPPGEATWAQARRRRIPVAYGGDHGPDLDEVAVLTGLGAEQVVRRHAAAQLEVRLLGFSPGFPYLGDLPPELDVPRLPTPRTHTPGGSVGITGRFSGIYPVPAPGGWRVIGRTPIRLFDPRRNPPAYLRPGDRVEFHPIGADAFDGWPHDPDDW